jgi:photolyase PhrII
MYWMRTSVRAHENPALDVALHLGRRLELPVFVYHALSERYPYASDRHHTFILEGAREVAGELGERGIGHAFHLERPGHRGPHLRTLAEEAAVVVTEEMPVPFLRRWTRTVSQAGRTPVWRVDAACVVPLPLTRRGDTERAFRFRRATADLRRDRVERPWPRVEDPDDGRFHDAVPWLPPSLPFEPVDWTDAGIPELIAACRIDHGIGPVPESPGGGAAGYARWEAFRAQGLASYHRRRNDPLRDGVSRLSPYLHYGHVSPFRIAREAAETGGEGARKFLDELLVWRELAHAFCFHHPDPDGIDALPRWAVDTLQEHAADPRPALPSTEALERARTGDPLWDAAQQSLLVHGELHNNVRMTWGKALLQWTRGPAQALARLLELNDRYALDGRDPNSRGGILWCLGGFDRPFDPPRPIVGRVRGRSTERHGRRLDVDRYRRQTGRAALPHPPRVAVVGSGIAGLALARCLMDHGLEVRIFDKGRRPGGRMATRVSRQGWEVNHGTQYFTARDPRFARWCACWIQEGILQEWQGRLVHLSRPEAGQGWHVEPATASRRLIAAGPMARLPAHLATDLDVHQGVRVHELVGDDGRWFLRVGPEGRGAADHLREEGPFDAVCLTPPAPQTAELLAGPAPELARRARAVSVAPCWAVIVPVDGDSEVPFDGAFLSGDPLSWIARDGSRWSGNPTGAPGDPGDGDGRGPGSRWILHAGPEWSRLNLESPEEEVARHLSRSFAALLSDLAPGASPRPEAARAHRWRYALPDAADEACLWDPDLGLGVAGDGWGGPRVEGAFLSGTSLAGRILGTPPTSPLQRAREAGAGPGEAVQSNLFDE